MKGRSTGHGRGLEMRLGTGVGVVRTGNLGTVST